MTFMVPPAQAGIDDVTFHRRGILSYVDEEAPDGGA